MTASVLTSTDGLAALRHWCRTLGHYEAAAFLRRRTRRLPVPDSSEGLPQWPQVELDSMGHRDRRPDLVEVVRMLHRGCGSDEWRALWKELLQILEGDRWP